MIEVKLTKEMIEESESHLAESRMRTTHCPVPIALGSLDDVLSVRVGRYNSDTYPVPDPLEVKWIPEMRIYHSERLIEVIRCYDEIGKMPEGTLVIEESEGTNTNFNNNYNMDFRKESDDCQTAD